MNIHATAIEPARPTILVIEDNPHDRHLLRQILELENYKVNTAACREEALHSITGKTPDLILLDVTLPNVNGFDLCRELTSLDKVSSTPVVFISALNEELDVLRGFDVGGSDFISKPIRAELLLARVRTHVQMAQLQRSLVHFNKNLETLVQQRTHELRVSEERLNLALESQDGGIWDWDLCSGQLYLSPRYHRSFGDSDSDIPTDIDQWTRLIHPEDLPNTLQQRNACLSGSSQTMDLVHRIQSSSGGYRWHHSRGVIVEYNEDGTPRRMVGNNHDITQKKKTEQLNRQLENHIINVKRMESLGTLAGGLAHEFNNILAVAFGLVDLEKLQQKQSGQTLSSHLIKLDSVLNRANLLVQQILTFSTHKQHETRILNLSTACPEIVSYLKAIAPANISLSFTCTHSELYCNIDNTQLHQILSNLFLNAIHAIDKTKGRIDITLAPIDISQNHIPLTASLQTGKYVQILFRDNGRGISDENQSRIFEPFFTTKKADNGTGMGLAIVHGIVSGHGGHVSVKSSKQEHTTFSIYLPLISNPDVTRLTQPATESEDFIPTDTASEHQPNTHTGIDIPNGSNITSSSTTILFIDDEPEMAHFVSSLLSYQNIAVDCFTDPELALEQFSAHPEIYSVVVSDQSMPEMNGLVLARHLKEIKPDIPILILTGLNDFQQQLESDGPITEICTKPIKSAQLVAKILSYCNGA